MQALKISISVESYLFPHLVLESLTPYIDLFLQIWLLDVCFFLSNDIDFQCKLRQRETTTT